VTISHLKFPSKANHHTSRGSSKRRKADGTRGKRRDFSCTKPSPHKPHKDMEEEEEELMYCGTITTTTTTITTTI